MPISPATSQAFTPCVVQVPALWRRVPDDVGSRPRLGPNRAGGLIGPLDRLAPPLDDGALRNVLRLPAAQMLHEPIKGGAWACAASSLAGPTAAMEAAGVEVDIAAQLGRLV